MKCFNLARLLLQLEVDVTYDEIIPRKSEGEWNKIAPVRVLSVDIECQGRKGHFPEADKDPVIQIANVLSVYGHGKTPIVQVGNVLILAVASSMFGTNLYNLFVALLR